MAHSHKIATGPSGNDGAEAGDWLPVTVIVGSVTRLHTSHGTEHMITPAGFMGC